MLAGGQAFVPATETIGGVVLVLANWFAAHTTTEQGRWMRKRAAQHRVCPPAACRINSGLAAAAFAAYSQTPPTAPPCPPSCI